MAEGAWKLLLRGRHSSFGVGELIYSSLLKGRSHDANRCAELPNLAPVQDEHRQAELLGTTPIQALPPASAIDLDVLDALPLHLKRELERAYGEVTRSFRDPANAGTSHRPCSLWPTCSLPHKAVSACQASFSVDS